MNRLVNMLVGCALLLLMGGGCLLSPQPEPPDVRNIDDEYPGFYDDYAPGAVPPSDGEWSCDDTDLDGFCDDSGNPAPGGCGCRSEDEDPGDCGEDTAGPTDVQRARLYQDPENWVVASDDDQAEPTVEY